jgi:hypothetical protein
MKIQLIYKNNSVLLDAPDNFEVLKNRIRSHFKDSLQSQFFLSYISEEKELNADNFKIIMHQNVPELKVYIKENPLEINNKISEEEKSPLKDKSFKPEYHIKINKMDLATEFSRKMSPEKIQNEQEIDELLKTFLQEKLAKEIPYISSDIKNIISQKNSLRNRKLTYHQNELLETSTNPFTGEVYSDHWKRMYDERVKLTAWNIKNEFQLALDEFPLLIVEGRSSTGRTTQIPQFTYESLSTLG